MPWSSLYLGESKYNIAIKPSRLYVLFHGWFFIFSATLCVLLIAPLKYYGFILVAALCLGLLFYKWVSVKPLLFYKLFTASVGKVEYLSLRVEGDEGLCNVTLHKRFSNAVSYIEASNPPQSNNPDDKPTHSNILTGVISPRSRTSSIGAWLIIEPPLTNTTSQVNAIVKKPSSQSFFLFQDNMSLSDFKRICRMVNYVKYSAA